MPGAKRNRLQGAPPTWAVVSGMLHMRLKDAAAELNVPDSYLRRLCHQNGYATWPGKRIRLINRIGWNGSPWAGYAGPSKLATKIAETKKKDEDMTWIQAPVVNHRPPGGELTTLNLIDKVGSSYGSEPS